jgi:DMSO/TMAO reductase YedYZ heme-binding membrane subunit
MASPRRAPILIVTSAALVALLVFAYAAAGWSEDSVRITVRWTAKIAVVLFAAAFSASSLQSLFRNGATRWLMVNRRRLGLGFALAHTVHLFALVVLGLAFPDPFVAGLNAVTILGGGLAYVFMFAMAATSNDASVRRLGGRRWRLLHTLGGWYIWVVFAQSYGPRAAFEPSYLPFAALIVGVLGVRVARRIRARSRRLSGPAAA